MIKQFVKQELVKRGCRGITTGIATSHEGFGSLIVPNLRLEELQPIVGGCLNHAARYRIYLLLRFVFAHITLYRLGKRQSTPVAPQP